MITQRQHTTRHQKLSHGSAGQVCSEKHCLARAHPSGQGPLGLTPQPFTFLACFPRDAPWSPPISPGCHLGESQFSGPGTDTPNPSERGSTATSQHPLHAEPTRHLQHQETFHLPLPITACCMTCSRLQWQTRNFGPFQAGGFGAGGAQPLTALVLAQEGRQWTPKQGGNI